MPCCVVNHQILHFLKADCNNPEQALRKVPPPDRVLHSVTSHGVHGTESWRLDTEFLQVSLYLRNGRRGNKEIRRLDRQKILPHLNIFAQTLKIDQSIKLRSLCCPYLYYIKGSGSINIGHTQMS